MIYADNAATTKLDPAALDAMMVYLKDDYSNSSQPYSFSRYSKKALRESREIIANVIGAAPEEIYFTSGGSESDNWALKGLPYTEKSQIITSMIEHHAILNTCKEMEKHGIHSVYLRPEIDGTITADNLESEINNNTSLVSIMTVNNEIGTVQPVSELAEVAHKHGALFHTDAVQAVGHIPVNVKETGVDMLSASAHKFNGPRGIGFLYIKKGTPLSPFINGGAQEKHMRAGTENVASIVAMAEALRINAELMEENEAKLIRCEKIIEDGLKGIDYIRNGGSDHSPGVMSLSFRGMDGEALLHRMDLMNICISTGSACTSGRTTVSHVIDAIGLEDIYAKGTIRISLGRYNDEEDAVVIAKALRKIIGVNV